VVTGGTSNDAMSSLIALANRPYRLPDAKGVLGDLSNEVEAIGDNIRERGYHIFNQRLSDEVCAKLLEFGTTAPCIQRSTDGRPHNDVRLTRFPADSPEAIRFDFEDQRLIN